MEEDLARPGLRPLLPLALAVTAGILFDRYARPPLSLLLPAVIGCLGGWLAAWRRRREGGVFWLWAAALLLGASFHHLHLHEAEDDIGRLATEEGTLVKLRGMLLADFAPGMREDARLVSVPEQEWCQAPVAASLVWQERDWRQVQGRCRLIVGASVRHARAGDTIQVVAELRSLPAPANPGEPDLRAAQRDQGMHAVLSVDSPEGVQVVSEGAPWQARVWLARLRGWSYETLDRLLPTPQAGVAQALLLGDQAAIDRQLLDEYLRTGVFHVLAVSGQHLVILCAALWMFSRLVNLPRGAAAWWMAAFVLGYALLTGGRPPVVRAAVIVGVACGGIVLRRQPQVVNSLALAWLIIALLNPGDLFQPGCQLSFLAVIVLCLLINPWRLEALQSPDPLARLVDRSLPPGQRLLRQAWGWLRWALLASLLIWLASAPLLAARYHLVSPVAVPLSPFLILLTSLALITGFLTLVAAAVSLTLAQGLAWVVNLSLEGCERLVRFADRLPGGHWYCGDLPEWWLAAFYLGFLAFLLCPRLARQARLGLTLALGWLAVLLAVQPGRGPADELRCTFLAVGHGGCAVLETPDGRVLLYDAGSLAGPSVAARHIAPYLWSRGITRIDEVYLSHADLDHFNGLPALLDRFRVALVSLTPSFFDKLDPGVKAVREELSRRGVEVRTLSFGQELRAGGVTITVLHPPRQGPAGTENARSLVLLVQYQERSLLLTGDLEEPGLSMVVGLSPPAVDILLAPHHGSVSSNTERFARWAQPGLVVSSEGRPRGRRPDPYSQLGAVVWRTWPDGAVSCRLAGDGIHAETHRTARQWKGR